MTRKHDQELSGAAWAYIESEEFQEKFCEGCDACRVIPATWTCPEEVTCPAELDILDGRCVRFDRMDEIMDALDELDGDVGL
jgi:predicted aldo/keto reductase-like oxidoreductase